MTESKALQSALEAALQALPEKLAVTSEQSSAAHVGGSLAQALAPEPEYRLVTFFDELLDGALQQQAKQLELAIQDALSRSGRLTRAARDALALAAPLEAHLARMRSVLSALDSQVVQGLDLGTAEKVQWRNTSQVLRHAFDQVQAALERLQQAGGAFNQAFDKFSELPRLLSGGIWDFVKRRPRGTRQVFARLLRAADRPLQVEPVSLFDALAEYAGEVQQKLDSLVSEVESELARLHTGEGEQAQAALRNSRAVLGEFCSLYNELLSLCALVQRALEPYGPPAESLTALLLQDLESELSQLPGLAGLEVIAAQPGAALDTRHHEVSARDPAPSPEAAGTISRLLAVGLAVSGEVITPAKVAVFA